MRGSLVLINREGIKESLGLWNNRTMTTYCGAISKVIGTCNHVGNTVYNLSNAPEPSYIWRPEWLIKLSRR